MERITKRIGEKYACYAICEKECPDGIYADNAACMCTASKMAMKRLLEYEDTGLTPEQIRELKERDTAKAPEEVSEEYGYFECPSCGKAIYASDNFESHKFCLNCGQRLKWED